jgi:hypothetical protein
MSHPASTVRQQVSQLWEKVVDKRSSGGTALQHNVMRSLMSVVARHGNFSASTSSGSSSCSGKADGDWAGIEAALMSLELVLRKILTPLPATSSPPSSSAGGGVTSKSTSDPLTPAIVAGHLARDADSSTACSSVSSGSSNQSLQLHKTPLHPASLSATSLHLATPSSPPERSPKPSPMQGSLSFFSNCISKR